MGFVFSPPVQGCSSKERLGALLQWDRPREEDYPFSRWNDAKDDLDFLRNVKKVQ